MISSASAKKYVDPRRCRGGMLASLLAVLLPLALVAWLALRVAPAWARFHAVAAALDAVAADPHTPTRSPGQIYLAVVRRAGAGVMADLSPDDVEIQQTPGQVVLHVAYFSTIPLFGPYSLLVHFTHDSPEAPITP